MGRTASLARSGYRSKVTLARMEPACVESAKQILHDGYTTRVVLRRDLISVGCTDVTPEALKYVLEQWEKKFGAANEEVVLQP